MDSKFINKKFSSSFLKKAILVSIVCILFMVLMGIIAFFPYDSFFLIAVVFVSIFEIGFLVMLWESLRKFVYDGHTLTVDRLFLTSKKFEIKKILGWKNTNGQYASQTTLYFDDSKKVSFDLSGQLLQMFQKIIEDNLERLKEDAKKNLSTTGYDFGYLFSRYHVNDKIVEIKSKHETINWNEFENYKITGSESYNFIVLMKAKSKVVISTHALRKNIGLFFALAEHIKSFSIPEIKETS